MTPSKCFRSPSARFVQNDFGLLAAKALPILPAPEFALDAGRTDFEIIGTGEGVVFIEPRADLMRNEFAIGVGDAFRLIDIDAQQLIAAGAFQFHLDDFETFRGGEGLGDALDF